MAKNKKADNQVSAVKTCQTRMDFDRIFLNPCGTVAVPDFPRGDELLKEKRIHHEISVCTPDHRSFFGIENFIKGVQKTNYFAAMGNSVIITVGSVAVIILCTSMCAWYITRVHNKVNSTIYMLCLFSMIVPFQMVMFSLSKLANMMHLSNPIGIILVYLGFGAGLAVFMFCGFVKSIPLEIEEAAMIDGVYAAPDLFPGGIPDYEADYDHGGNSAGNVDLERLSAALSGAGSEKIQDHPDCHPVFKGRLRSG